MPSLDQLEGKSLAGSYPLTRLLRTGSDRAWYATTWQAQPATAFIASSSKGEDQLIANLEAACRVKHPNILGIERVGRARIDGAPIAYAITEASEQNLAEVLRERPLDLEETTQITESLVAALGTLHEHGLLHGQVSTINVFAAGETVKLRSDCIYRIAANAKESADVYAQDLGDLGALIFQALTQRQLTSPDDPAIAKLPAPFAAIVASAVTGRWGLIDISAALKKPSIEPRHPVPVVAHPAELKRGEAGRASASAVLDGAPVRASAKKNGVRILAAFALAGALAFAWSALRTTRQPAASPGATTAPAMAVAPVQPAAAPVRKPRAARETAPVPGTSEKHDVWRVVVYTYTSENEAQRKSTAVGKSHPELKPEVFTAAGHGPYLVVVGGAMDRDEAFHLRDQVGKAGLPADSYTQNYSH